MPLGQNYLGRKSTPEYARVFPVRQVWFSMMLGITLSHTIKLALIEFPLLQISDISETLVVFLNSLLFSSLSFFLYLFLNFIFLIDLD